LQIGDTADYKSALLRRAAANAGFTRRPVAAILAPNMNPARPQPPPSPTGAGWHIAQEAKRVSLLFHYGVFAADAIIEWADTMIIAMDTPPDTLLELSTTAPDKTADIVSCLNRLSYGAEFWSALRSAIPQIRDFITTNPDPVSIAHRMAHHLGSQIRSTTYWSYLKMPDDLEFLFNFDDDFDHALDGDSGDPETVYREFIHELEKVYTP
jgi:hypothetical protein